MLIVAVQLQVERKQMTKTVLALIITATALPTYAIELHDAVILEHTSNISGADDNGCAIDGCLEEEQDKISS